MRSVGGIEWIYDTNGDLTIFNFNYDGSDTLDCPEINVPVTAGETYEDWCRVMQIDQIKDNDMRPEERDGIAGIWDEEGNILASGSNIEDGEDWLFSLEGYQGIYSEYRGDGFIGCEFNFNKREAGEQPIMRIRVEINNGVITCITYQNW